MWPLYPEWRENILISDKEFNRDKCIHGVGYQYDDNKQYKKVHSKKGKWH
jgi:hypothetical protein